MRRQLASEAHGLFVLVLAACENVDYPLVMVQSDHLEDLVNRGRCEVRLPATMRAFAIDRFGDPGMLRELLTPTIGADEMLVRARAAGVNPLDWKVRDGFKAIEDVRLPFVLGQDAAGVVVQGGPQVTKFGVGDEVYGGFWLAAAFAEYVRASASAAMAPKPARLDFARAAALPPRRWQR